MNPDGTRHTFNLCHLTSVEFEELCYDLLTQEGFKNLSWRKGTGFDPSTADQGRDIEAQRIRELIGEKCILETWFFECKHHKTGVSPSRFQGALAWAEAKCPNFLVLITSNYLYNPAKEYIDNYRNTRRPPFSIDAWEKKDLEIILMRHPHLMEKYRINSGTIDIILPYDIHNRTDKGLAKILRFMIHISKYSKACIQSILKNGEHVYTINLPVEHADSLNQILFEESKNEPSSIYLVPEPISFNLVLQRELPTSSSLDLNIMNLGKPTIEGFTPVIINILPSPLNLLNKEDES